MKHNKHKMNYVKLKTNTYLIQNTANLNKINSPP